MGRGSVVRQGLFLLSAKLLSNADFGFDADFGQISLIFVADFGKYDIKSTVIREALPVP